MQLRINGERQTVPDHLDVSGLLIHLGVSQRKIAVEVNQRIVPAQRYVQTTLSDNDVVEIIHAVGGG